MTGKEERVEATWIINATGPWADRICQRSRIQTPHPMVGGVRGSHIVMPRFAGAPDAAVYTEAVDKRPIFVIPWNEQVLVGTTEVADQGDPAKVQPCAGGDRLPGALAAASVSGRQVIGCRHSLHLCRSAAAALRAQGKGGGRDPQTPLA